MVDVGEKPETSRRARAEGYLRGRPEILKMVADGKAPKGDVLAVARVAAIMAVKRTSEWIPLCHPIAVSHVEVEIVLEAAAIRVVVEVGTVGMTGVEMEALTGVSAGLLTLYDMLKSFDRGLYITDIALVHKSGGKSGVYHAKGVVDAPSGVDS